MTEQTKELSHSEQQAVAQMESIREMVAALECDYERLEELREAKTDYEAFADSSAGVFCPTCNDDLIDGDKVPDSIDDDHAGDWWCTSCGHFVDDDKAKRLTWAEANEDDAEELKELEDAAGECENREEAETRIHEDPLSVEVRSGWYSPGEADADREPAEYCILLCTGGPACRIVGDLDGGEPTSARLQHQDWGTPWIEHFVSGSDRDTLVTYARQFLFAQ